MESEILNRMLFMLTMMLSNYGAKNRLIYGLVWMNLCHRVLIVTFAQICGEHPFV